jgi:2-polyprenyl-6-methoxyphenol hydroxylase-like FAD-dependent oxidoreductase
VKIAIVGAGPAGLYASILIKKALPDAEIDICDQSPSDATWGFGVVFSERALEFLRADDAETADLIEAGMETWSDITVAHKGEKIAIDGIGFSAIGRLEMLKLLQQQAAKCGVFPRFNARIDNLSLFDDADLVIAADGLNSVVRAEAPQAYGEAIYYLHNRFAWYGTDKAFPTLTQTFKETEYGYFNAHHYRYAPDRSTFLVECDAAAFDRAGFEAMPEPEYRAVCENIFAEELAGHRLIDNNSIWRRFPVLSNRRWHYRNRVLVGDALHTAHYSIGSGTRLAMEDVVALVDALKALDFNVEQALPAYQAARQPVLEKLTRAALTSAQWYESFGEHMALSPWEFCKSYILRSQRLSPETIRRMSPKFIEMLCEKAVEV